ncbi:MAG: hypothetical protein ACFFG0_19020 [Candidatus Thorarchaeota archaeon]
MVSDRTKCIVGIILLTIGLIILAFSFRTIMSMIMLPIPVICLPLGFVSLYRGLSVQNRAILLIVMGVIFISITIFIIYKYIRFSEPLIVLSIVNTTLWVLVFLIPGILKLIKKTTLGDKFKFMLALTAFTTFWMLIYTLIINNVAPSNFLNLYFKYFWPVLGGAFLFSLILIVIGVFSNVGF